MLNPISLIVACGPFANGPSMQTDGFESKVAEQLGLLDFN
jgi:hypothetical protein